MATTKGAHYDIIDESSAETAPPSLSRSRVLLSRTCDLWWYRVFANVITIPQAIKIWWSRRQSCTMVPPIEDGTKSYIMPPEESPHEGTWLQWPHDYGYDKHHVRRYEKTWVQMTRALHRGEMVHIIAYNESEKNRIESLLRDDDEGDIDMTKISFLIGKTDDVWARDNGPIFVRESESGQLVIENWNFNGWGRKADFHFCNDLPRLVSKALDIPRIDVSMVNEFGSVELDGRGTLMAKRSSILNKNRNPGWTQQDAERYFCRYLGVTNFIWLEGIRGGDITDDHIDGTARFANGNTIVTYYPHDSNRKEYKTLKNARDANKEPYAIVHLPVTKKKPRGLEDWGIYINFYVANEVVLVPRYGDPNDDSACKIMQGLYPTRKVVGVDALELAKDGGMIHCVTQQQPL